ncbi:hypothetical protein AM506_19985 [Rossellomorea vietnamensis]|uniref:Uncharacterized protein n=1 Tax=Rossellomorea vietnamensis TaxID=218284 RepID=A0A0P6VY93_9BACI|nr:hypothetical protein AM506_19985 [Rossellomorea vietnamensis]
MEEMTNKGESLCLVDDIFINIFFHKCSKYEQQSDIFCYDFNINISDIVSFSLELKSRYF